ncbi:glycosyltransferase [Chloroflexi bacterium TSY]|nr:glycosyltransferase [Chloroflexi bacterium TSY]
MRIAIIIVNYNVKDLLRNCLSSIYASAYEGFESRSFELSVVVVDNASADGSVGMVRLEYPQVDLLPLDENIGFTAANNLALNHLGFTIQSDQQTNKPTNQQTNHLPDYVFLLNPDTELTNDALFQLVQFLEKNPRAGLCGPQLRYENGTLQHAAFAFPNTLQVILDVYPLDDVPGLHSVQSSAANGRYADDLWQGFTPFKVDFVLGAAMMVRGLAIQEVGGLDEGFFMYCEEMDWCLRMENAGWAVYTVPLSRIIHHEGRSSGQVRWTAFVHLWQSRFRFYRKYHNRYSSNYLYWLRKVIWLGLYLRQRQAKRLFATGQVTGSDLAEELDAYAAVGRL